MATVAIVGASGYAGQETLDRVLHHQALELYRARLRLSRRAGAVRPRSEARPERVAHDASIHHERSSALVRRRPHVPLSPARRGGGDRPAGPGCRRRPLRRAPTVRCLRVSAVVRLRAPAGRDPAAVVVRASRATPPSGRLIANPGCYSTAVLLALAPIAGAIEPTGVVVDAKSGTTGAGRTPEPPLTPEPCSRT